MTADNAKRSFWEDCQGQSRQEVILNLNERPVMQSTGTVKKFYFHLTHSAQRRNARLARNWENARESIPWHFTNNIFRKLNYRQAKKRLRLLAYWE